MKKRILSSALVIALLISMFSATVHAALLPNVTINLEGDVSGIRQGDDATVLIEGESLQASVRTPNGKRVITIAVANPKNGAYVSVTVGELSGTSVLRKKVSTNTFTATVTLTAKAPSSNLSATYEYISGTAYKPLPSAITTDSGDYAVSDSNQYVVGATVTRVSNAPAVNTTYDAIENGVTVGTWTLVSWNTESATMTADGVKFVGTWEYKEAEKYGVTYEYTGKTPANAPAVPVDKRFYYVGATYKVDATTIADIPTYDEYGNVDGNWKFNGWTDENNGTMVTGGVTITGSWTYTPVDVAKYSVTYEYTSGTVGKELPAEITTASGIYAVSDSNQYVVGETVPRVNVTNTTHDAIVNGVKVGTWTLVSWTPAETATMTAEGVKFVGTWEYKEAEKYSVTYRYTGETPDDAPAVPVDERLYYAGEAYTVDDTAIADIPTYDEYGNMNGNWKFNGWMDENKGTMVAGGVTITGSWTCSDVDVAKYGVTYEYTSGTDGKKLPAEITTASGIYAVSDSNQYVVGETVTRVNMTNTTYDAIENGVKVGTWTLVSWTPAETATMTAEGVKFVGTWTYEEAENYGVTYEYTGETPANAPAVPVDERLYYAGETYTVDDKAIADIPTYDEYGNVNGNWTFNGWTDPGDGTMAVGGVTITGSWTHTPVDVATYTVSYDLAAGDGVTAPEASAISPASIASADYVKGAPVTIAGGPAAEGWAFLGWTTEDLTEGDYIDKTSFTMPEKDVAFVAVWEKTEAKLTVTGKTIKAVNGEEWNAQTMLRVGDIVTFEITVENSGNAAGTILATTITDVLQYQNDAGEWGKLDGTSVTWPAALPLEIAAGNTAAVEVTWTVPASAAGLTVRNTASIGGSTPPVVTPPVTVEKKELAIDKTVDKLTAAVGDTLLYTVSVTNNGNVTLENITVSDPMLDRVEHIDALEAGQTKTFLYAYRVAYGDAGKVLVNTAVAAVDGEKAVSDSVGTRIEQIVVIAPVEPAPPAINYEDHFAYIIGYEDGTVRPQNNITRAEVATIFFRLLTDESRAYYWSQDNDYSDVGPGNWFNAAVSTLANAGIITGYPDGTFKPNEPITRAEFAAIAARFSDVVYTGSNTFTDVADTHWAAHYIALAEHLGWINGYPDGSFKPGQDITRAETMTLVNRVLKRAVEKEHMLSDMVRWIDNHPNAWYYEAVQEATNSHEYIRLSRRVPGQDYHFEDWIVILPNPDWAALEKVYSTAYSK